MAHILANTRLTYYIYRLMGQIRITGGTHRSRKIQVEDLPGLRPTADRIRETLFNWLGNDLSNQHVLDLYTGSGILAFEAASRHATQVTCIDNNSKAIKQLRKNNELMQFKQIQIHQQQARNFLQQTTEQFDLIFLDPPFDGDELNAISGIITPLTHTGGLVYREYGIAQDIEPLNDEHWTLVKQKKAGQVRFELWQKK